VPIKVCQLLLINCRFMTNLLRVVNGFSVVLLVFELNLTA